MKSATAAFVTAAAIVGGSAAATAAAQPGAPQAPAAGDAARGKYLASAAGCQGCHTDTAQGAVAYAGGRRLETPFGTFYGPNVTPHPDAGIGRWTETDFTRALRNGVRPDGAHYYPSFPYASFTRITDDDLRDLWSYFRSLPPSDQRNRPHELGFPYGARLLIAPWKWLFFRPGPVSADSNRPAIVARGEYLTVALGHCGECHTPRNFLGAKQEDRHLAGVRVGGRGVPNLTPTRLKRWNDEELKEFLITGYTPDFDSVNETMGEVIRNTTSQLTPDDLAAMIAYLRSLPPLPEPER